MSQAQSKTSKRPVGQSATGARVVKRVGEYNLDPSNTARALAAGLLMRVRELLRRDLDAELSQFGMSHARHQVLAIICGSPEGLRLNEIAARAFVHPTTMTSTIDRLLRDGLIERRATPSDRRAILAIATQKGHELYGKTARALVDMKFGLADVDADTLAALWRGLDKVALVLEDSAAAEQVRPAKANR